MAVDDLDRVAVQRDAILVHALATRTLPPDEVDIHDPVVGYLAAWVDWVDEGAEEMLDAAAADSAADWTSGASAMGGKDRVAGRRKRAALIAGSTVAALVVSSGAAAAVTGDPFLVAKAPLKVFEKVNPFDDESDREGRDTLPEQTPDVAKAEKLLANAQRAAAQGDMEKAQRLVDKASALLGDRATPGQQVRIEQVIDHIESGSDSTKGQGQQPGDVGQPVDPGSQPDDGPAGQGGNSGDKDPVDKDPADKDPADKDPVDKDPVDKDPAGGPGGGNDAEPGGSSGQPPDHGGDQGKGQGSGKSETRPQDPAGGKGGNTSGQANDHPSSGQAP